MKNHKLHSHNNKVVDPTDNVLYVLKHEVGRMNDLNAAESRRVDEQMALRADYEEKLKLAEAKRIDAIRAVDVAAVAVANDKASAQAMVLANQVAISAEALRSSIQATALTVANQLEQLSTQLTGRIALLEKSQYEKQGSSGGYEKFYSWIIAALMAGVAIYSVFLKH